MLLHDYVIFDKTMSLYKYIDVTTDPYAHLRVGLLQNRPFQHGMSADLLALDSKFNYYILERSGSGVELRTLDYENPGSNPGCGVKTLGKFFHSTLLQFTQLNKNEYLDNGGYVYEQRSRVNCSKWLDASQRSRDGV